MAESHRVIKVGYHADDTYTAVCAHCICGWESNHYRLTGTELEGHDIAVVAAEIQGIRHVEQASSLRL
jgi:hypothetical protein